MKSGGRDTKTGCPDNEKLINSFLKKGGLEEKERLIDHILACQICKLKFDALKQISIQLGTFTDEFEGDRLSTSEEQEFRKMARLRIRELNKKQKMPFLQSLPARYLAMVAAALLIVIAGYFLITKLQQRDVYREGESGEFRLIEPVGTITEVPSVFIWTPYEEADNYLFRVIDDELNIIIRKGAFEAKTTLSEDEKKKLLKGKTYIWEVKAQDLFHKEIISDRKHFEIRKK